MKSTLLLCAMAANRYMLVSSPQKGMVYYVRLNSAAEEARGKALVATQLIAFGQPKGIDVDQAHEILYVADATTNSIVSTGLTILADGALIAGPKVTVLSGADAIWLTVDSQGNLFYSNPTTKKLMMIESNTARTIFRGSVAPKLPTELYASAGPPAISSVSTPHGVYADNFSLYWTNGNAGTTEGALVRAPEIPAVKNKERDVELLQKNVDVAFGVCGSPNSIYYTSNGNIFGTRRSGGAAATVSTSVLQPRGCQWDGSGALWVCDRSGKIFQFPADVLIPDAPKQLILEIVDPYDVTRFNSAWSVMTLHLALFIM